MGRTAAGEPDHAIGDAERPEGRASIGLQLPIHLDAIEIDVERGDTGRVQNVGAGALQADIEVM